MAEMTYEEIKTTIVNDIAMMLVMARDKNTSVSGRGSSYHEAYYSALLAEDLLKMELPDTVRYQTIEKEYHRFRDENPEYAGWGDSDPDFRYGLKERIASGKRPFDKDTANMLKDIHESLEVARDPEMPAESRGNGYHDALYAADIAQHVLNMNLAAAYQYKTILAEYHAWRDETPEYSGWAGCEHDDSYHLQDRIATAVNRKVTDK